MSDRRPKLRVLDGGGEAPVEDRQTARRRLRVAYRDAAAWEREQADREQRGREWEERERAAREWMRPF